MLKDNRCIKCNKGILYNTIEGKEEVTKCTNCDYIKRKPWGEKENE